MSIKIEKKKKKVKSPWNICTSKRRCIHLFFYFLLAPGVQDFVLTNHGGAQALGKEFPASAPRVIQGAIKFP